MTQIIIKSSCSYTLNAYTVFLKSIFNQLNVTYSFFFLPAVDRKLTILKSPHVNKKAKEQFKLTTYKVIISFNSINATLFMKNFSFFILNKPKAISIKIKS
jgi:ribosomal protein S10